MSWNLKDHEELAKILLIFFCVAVLALLGWGIERGSYALRSQPDPVPSLVDQGKKRFVVGYSQRDGLIGGIAIIRDRTTGREYLWAKVGNAGGLALMPDDRRPTLCLVPE